MPIPHYKSRRECPDLMTSITQSFTVPSRRRAQLSGHSRESQAEEAEAAPLVSTQNYGEAAYQVTPTLADNRS